jgi:histidine ammonia-lyase
VHGALQQEILDSEQILENEINSSTDNPLIFSEQGMSVSGGNFHGIFPARVSDRLASALATLASISERRTSLMMASESSLLPPFLVEHGGLHSGFMMVQVTAAALTSEAKSLCFPASVDSIPTSGDREDHVSMGVGAGLKTFEIVGLVEKVLAIEFLCACQGLDFLRPLQTSSRLEAVHARFRKIVPHLKTDRVLANDIESAVHFLRDERNLQS